MKLKSGQSVSRALSRGIVLVQVLGLGCPSEGLYRGYMGTKGVGFYGLSLGVEGHWFLSELPLRRISPNPAKLTLWTRRTPYLVPHSLPM